LKIKRALKIIVFLKYAIIANSHSFDAYPDKFAIETQGAGFFS